MKHTYYTSCAFSTLCPSAYFALDRESKILWVGRQLRRDWFCRQQWRTGETGWTRMSTGKQTPAGHTWHCMMKRHREGAILLWSSQSSIELHRNLETLLQLQRMRPSSVGCVQCTWPEGTQWCTPKSRLQQKWTRLSNKLHAQQHTVKHVNRVMCLP